MRASVLSLFVKVRPLLIISCDFPWDIMGGGHFQETGSGVVGGGML